MTLKKHYLISVGVGILIGSFSHEGRAGRIQVVNENKKALTIRVQAEGDTLNENLATYVRNIPAQHYFSFRIEAPDLKGKSHFSLKGETEPFILGLMGDRCSHLSADKDYKVTFLNDTVGTTCVAEEVKKKASPSARKRQRKS